jgi:hypothetical protein
MNFFSRNPAWCVWMVLMFVAALTLLNNDGVPFLVVSVFLLPLTGFLVIRGILRWTGKQLRHSAKTD